MKHYPLLASLVGLVFTLSCENNPVDLERSGFRFGRGVFIVNEGVFQSVNASLSFYDPVTDSVQNHVFYRANGVPLGDVANSMSILGDDAWIVVNNSGRIYRAGRVDMKFRGKITGLTSPRYLALVLSGENGLKGYVSDLYAGGIRVLDLREDRVVDSIELRPGGEGLSSEQMILDGNRLYLACWSYGEQVLVLDTGQDRLVDSIQVGKQPNSLVLDRDHALWVLCDGGFAFSPAGQEKASLVRVNLESLEAETRKTWDDISQSPFDLCRNPAGDSLYLIAGDVYKVSLEMEGFREPLIPRNGRQFYSLGVDPVNGDVYVGDAVDYQQDGWVYRFSPRGATLDSFRVGVNPGYFCFTPPTQR